MYLMGIDVGSTTIKAVVFEETGKLISKGSTPTVLSREAGPGGTVYSYWDPENIWQGAVSAIREALSAIADPGLVKAIAVTGMGMDAVPIDGDGNALYPFISWHCNRTAPQSKRLTQVLSRRELFGITGQQMSAIHTVCRLLWIRENRPDVYHGASKWLLMPDFINFKLCGSTTIDSSMASTTGLYDLASGFWNRDILARMELDESVLPELKPSGSVIGAVTGDAGAQTGIRSGTLVVQGGHDYVCATLPVGAYKPGIILNIVGTWEMVLTTCGSQPLDDSTFQSGLKVDSHVIPGKRCIVADAVASDMLEWFIRELGGFGGNDRMDKFDYRMELNKKESAWSKLLFLPHFFGSPTPYPDELSKGAFLGLRDHTSVTQMYKSVVEGLNFQFLDMLLAIQKGQPGGSDRICVVGGLTKNSFYMQNKADICGMELLQPDISEATSLGCALLAGLGAGIYSNIEDATASIAYDYINYLPNESNHMTYEKAYQLYKQIYPSIRQVNHNLDDLIAAI